MNRIFTNKLFYNKLFYYELKRLICNRTFPGMLLLNGVYAWFVLRSDILMGVACTAPFSVWSYCAYLGKTLPLAVMTALLLLAGYYSRRQKKVEILTDATPATPCMQTLLRTAATGTCFILVCILIMLAAFMFYARLFRFHDFGAFFLPSLLMMLPCFLFCAGLGQLLGRIHQSLVYLLILILFAAGFFGLSDTADLFGTGYFRNYPLTLPTGADGEPAFVLTAAFIRARAAWLVTGALCIYINIRLSGHKGRKA